VVADHAPVGADLGIASSSCRAGGGPMTWPRSAQRLGSLGPTSREGSGP
jgi:hypothetical protein